MERYFPWLEEGYREALRDAVRRLRPTSTPLPEAAKIRTMMLANLVVDGAERLSGHNTEQEMQDLLRAIGKVVICRAIKAAAVSGTEADAKAAQDAIWFVGRFAAVVEGSLEIGPPPGLCTPDMACFCDAHNAAAGLLSAQPSAVRHTEQARVRGESVTWDAPPVSAAAAPKIMLDRRLRLLSEPDKPASVGLLVAPGSLDMNIGAVAEWALFDGAAVSPQIDPGAADAEREYVGLGGFSLADDDAFEFSLGGARLGTVKAVYSAGRLHRVSAFRVYCWQNSASAMTLEQCTTCFVGGGLLKKTVRLEAPRKQTEAYATYRLKEKSLYLRIDFDDDETITAARVYAMS